MNSKAILTTILAFAIISTISGISNVFATGGLDDEEEEEAIKELQNDVSSIEDSVDELTDEVEGLTLNLEEGLNDVTAICPTSQPEPVINETNDNGCQPIPEPEPEEPPQSIIPEPVINETESCQPIPEPEQNETSDLEPIICPINGELLGYTNTTSGEQLPISAGNQTVEEEQPPQTGGFLPPFEIPNEEEQEQTVAPEVEAPSCNVTAPAAEEEPVQNNVTAPIEDINYDLQCQCFVAQTPELEQGGSSN